MILLAILMTYLTCLGEPSKKKNYQTLDIIQTWGRGVSGPAKLFFEKRYGHVLRGEGGQRASSKVVFW